ncbi:MAG TPA: zf-HC2 domain-containing protein [Longimicrobiales bacterium]|nr:zf-HC2 domain-containing protein [Longimicrobiales bacterium]
MSERAMLPCSEVIERLWEYIDGELDPQRTAQVMDHLQLCQRCFPHYDFQQAFQDFLRRHDRCQIPAGLRQKVFERLLAEEA